MRDADVVSVRGARQGLLAWCMPGIAGGAARHLCRRSRIRWRSPTSSRSASPRLSLLPVQYCVDEGPLAERGLVNYWGYNTLGFFCPDPRLAQQRDDPTAVTAEFRADGRTRCTQHGLEVVLDVVYNHTPEGNEHGPTLSFRGLDNASWYRLVARRPQPLREPDRLRQHAQRRRIRASPSSCSIRCATGCTRWASMVSASIWRRCSAAPAMASIRCAAFFTALAAGSDPGARAHDRRAVGRRLRRLPGRPLSRDASSSGTTSSATPCAATGCGRGVRSRRVRAPLHRLERPVPPRPAPPDRDREFRVGARRLHAGRRGQLRPASTTRPTARTTATAATTNRSQLRRRRARRDDAGDPAHAPARAARDCWPRCCWRRARRCCVPATRSATASRATTTPTARTTRPAGSTGPRADA